MEIKSLNNERNLQQVQQKVDVNIQTKQAEKQLNKVYEAGQSQKKQDSLQISDEAKRLQQIRNQLNQGYYNQPDVIKSTAISINESFPKNTQA